MQKNDYLKLCKCPFCGGKDLSIYLKGVNNRKYAVCCNTCDSRGERKPNKAEAIEAWNRRAKNESD